MAKDCAKHRTMVTETTRTATTATKCSWYGTQTHQFFSSSFECYKATTVNGKNNDRSTFTKDTVDSVETKEYERDKTEGDKTETMS